ERRLRGRGLYRHRGNRTAFPQGAARCSIVEPHCQLQILHLARPAAQIEADTKPDARAVAAGRTADADRNRRTLSRRRVITALKSDADLDGGGAFTRAFGSDEALQLQLALNRHAITVPFKRRLAAGAHGRRIADRRADDDTARPRRPARWRSG